MFVVALFVGLALFSALAGAEGETAAKDPKFEEQFKKAVEKAFVLREKAKELYKEGKVSAALAELLKITKLEFPKGAEKREEYSVLLYAHANAAKILSAEENKPDEALKVISAGIRKTPGVSTWAYDLYMLQGKILEGMDRKEDAKKAFDSAAAISRELEELEKSEETAAAKAKKETDGAGGETGK